MKFWLWLSIINRYLRNEYFLKVMDAEMEIESHNFLPNPQSCRKVNWNRETFKCRDSWTLQRTLPLRTSQTSWSIGGLGLLRLTDRSSNNAKFTAFFENPKISSFRGIVLSQSQTDIIFFHVSEFLLNREDNRKSILYWEAASILNLETEIRAWLILLAILVS